MENEADGSKMRLYMGKEGLCVMVVSSLTNRVYLLNESGGRPASDRDQALDLTKMPLGLDVGMYLGLSQGE